MNISHSGRKPILASMLEGETDNFAELIYQRTQIFHILYVMIFHEKIDFMDMTYLPTIKINTYSFR